MSGLVSNHAEARAHFAYMRTSAVAVLFGAFLVAACAGETSGTGTNPPTLWLAMDLGQTQMVLVGEEPHPY